MSSVKTEHALARARRRDIGWDSERHHAIRLVVEGRIKEGERRRRRVQVTSAFVGVALLGLALRAVGEERSPVVGDGTAALVAGGDAGLHGDGPVVD